MLDTARLSVDKIDHGSSLMRGQRRTLKLHILCRHPVVHASMSARSQSVTFRHTFCRITVWESGNDRSDNLSTPIKLKYSLCPFPSLVSRVEHVYCIANYPIVCSKGANCVLAASVVRELRIHKSSCSRQSLYTKYTQLGVLCGVTQGTFKLPRRQDTLQPINNSARSLRWRQPEST